MKIVPIAIFLVWINLLLGCVTVTHVADTRRTAATTQKRPRGEPIPRLTFKIDPRWQEWHRNAGDIANLILAAEKRGDFLTAGRLSVKAEYAEFFHLHSEAEAVRAKNVLKDEAKLTEARKRYEAQLRFQNAEGAEEVLKEMKLLEERVAAGRIKKPEHELGLEYVFRRHYRGTLSGVLFLLAYNGYLEKGVPLPREHAYLETLRESRKGTANTVADGVPADVEEKALRRNESLITLEEHFLNARHEEGRQLALLLIAEMLNQE